MIQTKLSAGKANCGARAKIIREKDSELAKLIL
jgi:hypothetical protein